MEERLNIEIKAKCFYPEKIREILKKQKAKYIGLDHQIDIYFKVSTGKLKLRQGLIENALIYYDRENKPGLKKSKILLHELNKNSAKTLKKILLRTLEILVTVDKKREIYFINNVKFHIDQVKNLGSFIEIEAQKTKDINIDKSIKQCKHYLQLFNIPDSDLIATSYSDLLMKMKK